MISDYSSLCFSYMMTGKPVGIMVHAQEPEVFNRLHFVLDYRTCYSLEIGLFFNWTYHRDNAETWPLALKHMLSKFPFQVGTKAEELQQIQQYIEREQLSKVLKELEDEKEQRVRKLEEMVLGLNRTSGISIHRYILDELRK